MRTRPKKIVSIQQMDPSRIERARLHYVKIALSRLEAVQYGTFTPYTLAEERAALEEYRRARYGAPPASDTFLYQIHPIRRRRIA